MNTDQTHTVGRWSPENKAFLAVMLGGIAIGSAAIFMRLSPVTPSSAAFWRMGLSVPLMLIWGLWAARTAGRTGPRLTLSLSALWPAALAGLFFAVDLALWHWAMELTSVANATLLANMAAVITPVVGILLFGQRFQSIYFAGLLAAVGGAVFLVLSSLQLAPENLVGDGLGLATAVAYAAYIISVSRARQTLSTADIMLWSGVFSGLLLLPLALWEEGLFIPDTRAGWAPLLGLALFAHMFGQGLIIYGLARVRAAVGALCLLIQPLVSALLAWMIFDEALTLYHLIGGALILSGIYLAKRGE